MMPTIGSTSYSISMDDCFTDSDSGCVYFNLNVNGKQTPGHISCLALVILDERRGHGEMEIFQQYFEVIVEHAYHCHLQNSQHKDIALDVGNFLE